MVNKHCTPLWCETSGRDLYKHCTPLGCEPSDGACFVLSTNIAPRWGAKPWRGMLLQTLHPAGVRNLGGRASTNIAPRWGAKTSGRDFYKHCTPLGVRSLGA